MIFDKTSYIFQAPMLYRGSFLRSNEKSGIKFLNMVNKLGVLAFTNADAG